MERHEKTKHRTTVQSSNSTPGYLSGENINNNLKRYIYIYIIDIKIYVNIKNVYSDLFNQVCFFDIGCMNFICIPNIIAALFTVAKI